MFIYQKPVSLLFSDDKCLSDNEPHVILMLALVYKSMSPAGT